MSQSVTVKDIKNKFTGYQHGDQAARDVHALVANFSSLKIQDAKDFVYSIGTRERLASVTGTIPVKIRGNTYNIPIAVWLKRNHPQHPPIVFVTPTSGMAIQPSQFVDTNGMVYLPYLNEWKGGSSDLSTLSQILCATFAEHCPVFSRPAQPQWQPPAPVQPPTSYRSPTPYPSSYPPAQGPSPQQQYPGYPTPYPTGGTQMPTPYSTPYSSYQQTPPTSSVATAHQPPYPVNPPGQYPQQPPVTSSVRPPARPPPPSTSSIAMVAAAAAAGGTIAADEERRQIEESERIKRQSLETAVEDKIRRHVTAVLTEAEREMDALQKSQNELLEGSRKINEMMEEMEKKEREVDDGIDLLRNKNTELESVLEYLRALPDDVNIDEAVMATTPLYEQVLQLYAEENAVEDTIYYLGEALRKGVIELEAFLKYIRELSRTQFMARATIMKARTTAGLPQYGQPS